MKRRILVFCLVLGLILAGCAWPDGEYLSVSPHQEHLTGIQSGDLQAANYPQLRQVLCQLVENGTESAIIHVPDYAQDLVELGMETAVIYIRDLLPLGSYAVKDVEYEIGTLAGLPAISVSISYIHGRSEIRNIRNVATMDDVQRVIGQVLEQCAEGVVLLVDSYAELDIPQLVEDYAEANPDLVMEIPQVAVGVYPDSGASRVVELKFSYRTSRDALRQMRTQVQRVFASAALYISSDSDPAQKYAQLYTFLTERFDYKSETSLTPSYSLLCHGVGDSEAFATVYAAMCRQAGLECRIVSGTHEGEAKFWNLICQGDVYYHVDLLESKAQGQLQTLTDDQMTGYVWDYSAYPAAGESRADT